MALQQLYLIYSNGLTWKLGTNKNGDVLIKEETQFDIGHCGLGKNKCCGYFVKYEKSFLHLVYGGTNHPSFSYNSSSNKIEKMDKTQHVESTISNYLLILLLISQN